MEENLLLNMQPSTINFEIQKEYKVHAFAV